MAASFISRCTVVSLAAVEDTGSESAALGVAKHVGAACRAILVTTDELDAAAWTTFGRVLDPQTGRWQDIAGQDTRPDTSKLARRRAQDLTALAQSIGMQMDVAIHQAAQALADLKAGSAEELLILVQPADPLMRQTQPFTALRQAAMLARAGVVFAPPATAGDAKGIIVLADGENDPAHRLAEEISQSTGEPVERSPLRALADLARQLETRSRRRPALIVMRRDQAPDDPSTVSRIAMRLGIPILLLEPGPSEGKDAG